MVRTWKFLLVLAQAPTVRFSAGIKASYYPIVTVVFTCFGVVKAIINICMSSELTV